MRSVYIVLALLIAFTLVSCDEGINPILETDRQFTLFGALDMAQDTQFVRVIEIRPTLTTPGEKLDATFTSRQLDTDTTITWKDSVYTFEDGSVGHIFYAPTRVLAGKTYRINVRKPGSSLVTSATTLVPFHLEPSVQLEKVFRVLTTQLVATQRILWWSLEEEPYDVAQWYRFFIFDDYGFNDIRLSHKPASRASETHAGFWETSIDLVRDRDSLLVNYPEMFVRGYLVGLGMTMTVLDDKFTPPGGVFTLEALGQPGTLSNVSNGFGYIGSIGRFSAEWRIQDTTATSLGYKLLDNRAYPEIAARVWDAPIGTLERPRE